MQNVHSRHFLALAHRKPTALDLIITSSGAGDTQKVSRNILFWGSLPCITSPDSYLAFIYSLNWQHISPCSVPARAAELEEKSFGAPSAWAKQEVHLQDEECLCQL